MQAQQIDLSNQKFHGETYNAELDKERLSGQILKVYDVLKSGAEYACDELSYLSGVTMGSIPKRVSDLRIYHGFNITARRINAGLWAYKILPDRCVMKIKKVKPIGNKELFGQMFKAIYAYAAQPDFVNDAELQSAAVKWAKDMAERVKYGK